jgi:hypothetical protein
MWNQLVNVRSRASAVPTCGVWLTSWNVLRTDRVSRLKQGSSRNRSEIVAPKVKIRVAFVKHPVLCPHIQNVPGVY